jgi:hypothetical protein
MVFRKLIFRNCRSFVSAWNIVFCKQTFLFWPTLCLEKTTFDFVLTVVAPVQSHVFHFCFLTLGYNIAAFHVKVIEKGILMGFSKKVLNFALIIILYWYCFS